MPSCKLSPLRVRVHVLLSLSIVLDCFTWLPLPSSLEIDLYLRNRGEWHHHSIYYPNIRSLGMTAWCPLNLPIFLKHVQPFQFCHSFPVWSSIVFPISLSELIQISCKWPWGCWWSSLLCVMGPPTGTPNSPCLLAPAWTPQAGGLYLLSLWLECLDISLAFYHTSFMSVLDSHLISEGFFYHLPWSSAYFRWHSLATASSFLFLPNIFMLDTLYIYLFFWYYATCI